MLTSNRQSLSNNRGLSISKPLNENRGLKDIKFTKMFSSKYFLIYDDEFENDLINEIGDMIKFSPNTYELLGKVYNKYSGLYENNINKFNDKMKDIKLKNEGRLTRDDIENELRDQFYWQKHRTTKRPEKFQYKNKVNLDKM